MDNFIASSGSLILTTLEAGGYLYQQYLLDTFSKPFAGEIGGFIYLIGILVALSSLVIYGQYKFAPWFVIGPILFFTAVFARIDTKLPEWRFGGKERDQTQRDEYLAQLSPDLSPSANATSNVSSLFAEYNVLVSGVVQEVVRVIADGRGDIDYKFLLRAQIKGDLEDTVLPDTEFRDLVNNGFFGQCANVLQSAQQLTDATYVPTPGAEPLIAKKQAEMFNKLTQTQVVLSEPAMRYLSMMELDYGTRGALGASPIWMGPSDPEEIGSWVSALEQREKQGASFITGQQREAELKKAQEKIESWNRDQGRGSRNFTCEQVWGMVYAGLHRAARQQIREKEDFAVKNGIEAEELYEDLLKANGFNVEATDQTTLSSKSAKLDMLTRVVANYTIQNSVLETGLNAQSAFLSRFIAKGQELDVLSTGAGHVLSEQDRHKRKHQEWKQKTEAFTSAMSLPYYQGLMLFFLAALYPFFALLLLVPGKHGGFLYWFILWFWVKSWDIGFAVMMSLDEILYSIMGEVRNPLNDALQFHTLQSDIDRFIYSLGKVDSSFTAATYYTIMAVGLHAIPVITAQILLGGLKGGAGLIARGMNNFSTSIGVGASNSTMQKAMDNSRSAAVQLKGDMFNARMQAASVGINPNTFFNGETGRFEPQGRLFTGRGFNARSRSDMQSATLPLLGGGHDNTYANAFKARLAQGAAKGYLDGILSNGSGGSGATVGHLLDGLKKDRDDLLSQGKDIATRNLQINALEELKDRKGTLAKVAGVVAPISGYVGDSLYALNDEEIKLVQEWAAYDAINSEQVQRLGGLATFYGGMPLPWTEGAGYNQEVEYEKKLLDIELDGGIAATAAVESVAKDVFQQREKEKKAFKARF